MQDFDYVAARGVDEVVSLLNRSGGQVRILSGGTDLLVQLREGRRIASLVVDVKGVSELNELQADPAIGLRFGAAVTCLTFCTNPQVRALYPGLVDGASLIGGTQIQGRATIGGNLCNASPAGDTIPALIVHEAVCEIAGPNGRRELPVRAFCIGPGRNALQPGEFLVAVRVPPVEEGFGARYLRFIPRNEMDIAVVGAGAAVKISPDGSTFEWARLALGAVAPTPLALDEAGDFLAGKAIAPDTLLQAAMMAREVARPINDMRGTIDQRRHLCAVLARRALEGAVERARQGMHVPA